MRTINFLWAMLIVFVAALSLSVFAENAWAADLDKQAAAPAAKPTFDKVGPQVGEQVPNLRLSNLQGEPQQLGDAWRGGPALIVTSSLTCPKSRSRWPELTAIAKKYNEKVNVVIVYVIEAHPVGSPCPYKGVEDITPENQRDGILRRQPEKLEGRQELAKEFKRYLRIGEPIYVDAIDNRAWKALGSAPNIALLVDSEGHVVARQGWFEGPAMQKLIDAHFSQKKKKEAEEARNEDRLEELEKIPEPLEKSGLDEWDLRKVISEGKLTKLNDILKEHPVTANIVFAAQQGHPEQTTWLMEAALAKNVAAARLLLQHGADVNERTRDYTSALQVAAEKGDLPMAELLLRHKADPRKPATGKTPVHEALLAGHTDVAKALIAAGGPEDMYTSIGLGHLPAVREALKADPSRIARPDGADRMPLDYAVASGQVEMTHFLLDQGAPVVDAKLSAVRVPLHYAIDRGNVELIELLLAAGHSPNTSLGWRGESPTSRSPLHMAIDEGQMDIVKVLLAHRADLNVRDTYSKTPLHTAASSGKTEMVQVLLGGGADVNALTYAFSLPCGSGEEETPQHNTPLHFAAARGKPETIQALLAAGAKIDAPNVSGMTPLMSTLEPPIYTGIEDKMQLKNMETLLKAGAAVNARDKDGRTALDWAGIKRVHNTPTRALTTLLRKYGAKPGEVKAGKVVE